MAIAVPALRVTGGRAPRRTSELGPRSAAARQRIHTSDPWCMWVEVLVRLSRALASSFITGGTPRTTAECATSAHRAN